MVEGVETEILCSICDEVCKRGAKLKCCGVRACRACAVVKINKNKNCWNEECGKEVNAATELINDVLLRKVLSSYWVIICIFCTRTTGCSQNIM